MMPDRTNTRGWLWARTCYLLTAIALFWVSCFNWDAFLYGTVFVLMPWTVLMVSAGLARGQVKRDVYHILLFAVAAIFTQAAVRNGNLPPLGLLAVGLGFAAVLTGSRAFAQGPRRGAYMAGFAVAAIALALVLLTAICQFFEIGGLLPWVAKGAAGGHSASQRLRVARERTQMLKGLTVLTYAWGAMLVAGIVPREADGDHLRREGGIVSLFVMFSALVFVVPALVSVFIARPIVLPFLPAEKIGIQEAGAISDRIRSLQHSNKVAQLAVMGILCALYALMNRVGRRLKAILILSVALFAMALAHTQSRGSALALGLGLGALAFRAAYLRLAENRWRVPAGLAAGALSIALTVVLLNALFTADVFIATRLNASAHAEAGANNLMDQLRQNAAEKHSEEVSAAAMAGEDDHAVEVADGVVVSRAMASGTLSLFSSGRDLIWKEALDYLVHHPVELALGMGSGDVTDRMKAYNPNRFYAYHLHNGLLEALARGGVFMLLGVVWLLCLLVKPSARALVAVDAVEPGSCVFPVVIGVLLATSVVEALLFTDATAYNILFFWAAGRVMKH